LTPLLADAITQIQTMMDEITTFVRVYENPPDQIPQYPAAVVSMGAGEWHCEMGDYKKFNGNIAIDVFVLRQAPGLTQAYEQLASIAESIANKLLKDPNLGNTVNQMDLMNQPITQTAAENVVYDSTALVTVRWLVPVIIRNPATG